MRRGAIETELKFIGQNTEHNSFITNDLEGKVLGKEGRSRPRMKSTRGYSVDVAPKRSEWHKTMREWS